MKKKYSSGLMDHVFQNSSSLAQRAVGTLFLYTGCTCDDTIITGYIKQHIYRKTFMKDGV